MSRRSALRGRLRYEPHPPWLFWACIAYAVVMSAVVVLAVVGMVLEARRP